MSDPKLDRPYYLIVAAAARLLAGAAKNDNGQSESGSLEIRPTSAWPPMVGSSFVSLARRPRDTFCGRPERADGDEELVSH